MPRYSVQLPITGYVIVEVEADTSAAAIEAALVSARREEIEEWEAHRHTNRGNVAVGSCTEANAEIIGE